MTKWRCIRNSTAVAVLFGILLLFFIWGGLYLKMQSERQMELEAALRDADSYARIFAEHMVRTIDGLDEIALYLAERAEREGLALNLPRLMAEGRFGRQPIAVLDILDEKGDVAASTQVSRLQANFSDIEAFEVHKNDDSRKLFISKPQVSKASGKPIIKLTRRINHTDGSFRGVAVVALDPYYLIELYKRVDLDEGEIALIGWDSVVRVWQSGNNISMGQVWKQPKAIGQWAEGDARRLIISSPIDGVNRISTYYSLGEYPLTVLVGISEEHVLAGFHKRAVNYYWFSGAVSVVVILFIAMLVGGMKRREQDAKAIKLSEERLRLLLDSTAEGIYGIDLAGNCTFANPTSVRMLGYREEGDLLGKNMHCLIHYSYPDGRPMQIEECRVYRAFREGRGVHVKDEVLWKADGTSFPVEYWSYPQYKDGEVIGAVVTFLNITRRRAAEAALRDSEARYRILVDNASDIVYAVKEDGTVGYLSPSAEKSLGYPVSALLGRPFESFVHPDDHANCWEWVKAVYAGESLRDVEFRLRHSDGTWRWYSASAVPTKDSTGKVVGHYGIGRDITERKAAEEQICYLATHDALTGLPTTRLAREQAAAALRLARRHGTMAAVMFVDLDGFKMINDTYGHDAGDAVLTQVARTLTASVRDSDTVARAGGDEFLVFAAGLTCADDARTVAEKILTKLSVPIVWNDRQCMVSASIGIALYPFDGDDVDRLISLADAAMYKAKKEGKNGYRLAGDPGY